MGQNKRFTPKSIDFSIGKVLPATRAKIAKNPSGERNSAMPHYDFRTARLYIDAPLGAGVPLALDRAQSHYLRRVLRLKDGNDIFVFKGRDREKAARGEGGPR